MVGSDEVARQVLGNHPVLPELYSGCDAAVGCCSVPEEEGELMDAMDDTRLLTMAEKARVMVKLLKEIQAIADDEIRCTIDDFGTSGLSIRQRTELVSMRDHANKIIESAKKLYRPLEVGPDASA